MLGQKSALWDITVIRAFGTKQATCQRKRISKVGKLGFSRARGCEHAATIPASKVLTIGKVVRARQSYLSASNCIRNRSYNHHSRTSYVGKLVWSSLVRTWAGKICNLIGKRNGSTQDIDSLCNEEWNWNRIISIVALGHVTPAHGMCAYTKPIHGRTVKLNTLLTSQGNWLARGSNSDENWQRTWISQLTYGITNHLEISGRIHPHLLSIRI